jgi:hypothetical protein
MGRGALAGYHDDYLYDDDLELEVLEAVRAELSGPSDDEAALISQRITDLEDEAGLELSNEEFQRVGELIHEYGDAETAFNLVVREGQEAEDAWYDEFDAQLKKFEAKTLRRRATHAEREKVIEAHQNESDPDVPGAWEELYGKQFSDEEIAGFETEHQAVMERLREEGYSAEFVAKYDEENRDEVAERVAGMRRSGKGDFELNDPEGRRAYLHAWAAEQGPRSETVEPLSDDATPQETTEYFDARTAGVAVEERSGEGTPG